MDRKQEKKSIEVHNMITFVKIICFQQIKNQKHFYSIAKTNKQIK